VKTVRGPCPRGYPLRTKQRFLGRGDVGNPPRSLCDVEQSSCSGCLGVFFIVEEWRGPLSPRLMNSRNDPCTGRGCHGGRTEGRRSYRTDRFTSAREVGSGATSDGGTYTGLGNSALAKDGAVEAPFPGRGVKHEWEERVWPTQTAPLSFICAESRVTGAGRMPPTNPNWRFPQPGERGKSARGLGRSRQVGSPRPDQLRGGRAARSRRAN